MIEFVRVIDAVELVAELVAERSCRVDVVLVSAGEYVYCSVIAHGGVARVLIGR